MPPASPRRSAARPLSSSANANTDGPDPAIEQPSAPASNAAFFTAANPGMSVARSGSMMRSSMLRPSSGRSPRYKRRDERRDVADIRHDHVEAVGAVLDESPRLGGRHLAVRMDDGDVQAVRHRKLHDLERIVAAHEHESAHHARRHVIRVRRSRRGALPFHRAQHDVALRQRPPEDFVHGDRTRGAAGARASEPARQRHLFVQPQAQPLRAPARRSTSAAARLATFFIASRLSARRRP